MRIAGIHLTHFKRFTDLTIRGIGADVRLVILAGPVPANPFSSTLCCCGGTHVMAVGPTIIPSYRKDTIVKTHTTGRIALTFHGQEPAGDKIPRSFYFRTAYRNDPDFQQHQPTLQRARACYRRKTLRAHDRVRCRRVFKLSSARVSGI